MANSTGANVQLSSIGITENTYALKRRLGNGSFGQVYEAVCSPTQAVVAIKFVELRVNDKVEIDFVQREIRISNMLSGHPHVVALLDLVVMQADATTGNKHVGIVMELAQCSLEQCTLKGCSKPWKEDLVRWWFQQVVLAVDHCHTKQVCLRDIKPSNILQYGQHPYIRLADFGLSKHKDISAATTPAGTLIYMAPQVPTTSGEGGAYDGRAADVWSCGVVLFQLLFPRKFYQILAKQKALNQSQMRYSNWKDHLKPEQQHTLDTPRSAAVLDLLGQMLQVDPSQRITVAGVMQHPWFTGAGVEAAVIKCTPEQWNQLQVDACNKLPLIDDALLDRCLAAAGISA